MAADGDFPDSGTKPKSDQQGWKEFDDETRVRLWEKHEEIAMHFNDLTLRLRLQALAGVGAFSVIAANVFTKGGAVQHEELGWFLVALGFVWVAIALLDHFYYQALLKGTVRRLIKLEHWTPGIGLSTEMEAWVGARGVRARWAFFIIVALVLFVGGGWLIRNAKPIAEAECTSGSGKTAAAAQTP